MGNPWELCVLTFFGMNCLDALASVKAFRKPV